MENKKKSRIIFPAILAVLLLGTAGVGFAYTKIEVIPATLPSINFSENEVHPSEGSWVQGGLFGFKKEIFEKYGQEGVSGEDSDSDDFALPQSFSVSNKKPSLLIEPADFGGDCGIVIKKDGETVFEGDAGGYEAFKFSENGDYEGKITLSFEEKVKKDFVGIDDVPAFNPGPHAAGSASYDFTFTLDVKYGVELSAGELLQGDILKVTAYTGFSDEQPEIFTDLGAPIFIPVSDEVYEAFVPINYAAKTGRRSVKVDMGKDIYEEYIIVYKKKFGEQHLKVSKATTDATMGNPDGPKNWEERIKVLWETADPNKYWAEPFMMPCEGRISTEFGLYRYTEGSSSVRRHTGIDIAVPQGTRVDAANSGVVVRAEHIIYTGNSVVIEHGGGLKTYYFHMHTMDVKEGDTVERGQKIGTVGSTGYSTGPHLHFEVKIGRMSLDPWFICDEESSMYRLAF